MLELCMQHKLDILIFIRRFDKVERSLLCYSDVHPSVTNVEANWSETIRVNEKKLWEYVEPYQHFV